MKVETIVLNKKKGAKSNTTIKIKKGALKRQLKLKKGQEFSKNEINRLNKLNVGQKFKFKGNEFVMTKLMKQRVSLAKTMMGFKK